MRKKMAAAVLMAAMTASLLAGCGDSKSSDSTKADSAQTTASNQSEAGDSTSDLKDGKTEEYGTADVILDHPKDPYTKKLLAAVPKLQRKVKA